MCSTLIPKGKLLLIGGHEDKGLEIAGENLKVHSKKATRSHFEILSSLISRIPRAHHRIEIITAASSLPLEMEKMYIEAYKQAGFTQVHMMKVEERKDAGDPDAIKQIQAAHAVFFTGGDQNKLLALIAQTDLLSAIHKKYFSDPHFIVGGTSAGAMVMPETIITGGLIHEALYSSDIKMATGFGLISGLIVDTHFIKRGRFGRLAHAVGLNPDCLGVGLGEDTALLISEGNRAECLGSGMVILIDGREIGHTNIRTAAGLTPILIENLKVSILAEGSGYLFQERQFLKQWRAD